MRLAFTESAALTARPSAPFPGLTPRAPKRQRGSAAVAPPTRRVTMAVVPSSVSSSENSGGAHAVQRTVGLVCCHALADLDSFAAAVGLALLKPGTKVLIPAGEHPALARYLALHRSLFPIIDLQEIDAEQVKYVGVVDCHQKSRLGPAAEFLVPGVAVDVVDHHQDCEENCDIDDADVTFVPVGAVTTVIVERLRTNRVRLNDAEATIMAIAIHADTGNLTYENTTSRDAAALAWLLEQGACQRSISTFARDYLSPEQQRLLTTAFDSMEIHEVNGLNVASCLVDSIDFISGSAVAQVAMELSNVDAFLFGIMTPASRKGRRAAAAAAIDAAKKGKKAPPVEDAMRMSVIGRARSRVEGVDFASLFAALGGGGHAKAASAAVKTASPCGATECFDTLFRDFLTTLPEPIRVGSFMSKQVACVFDDDTMEVARTVLFERGHTGLAVVTRSNGNADNKELQGVISRQDVATAERKGLLSTKVKGWIARKVIAVSEDTTLFEVERMLAEHKIGRLPVVRDGTVVGIVTRSDVLRQRRWLQ